MKDYDGKALEAYTLYVLAIESFLLGMKCKLLQFHNFNSFVDMNFIDCKIPQVNSGIKKKLLEYFSRAELLKEVVVSKSKATIANDIKASTNQVNKHENVMNPEIRKALESRNSFCSFVFQQLDVDAFSSSTETVLPQDRKVTFKDVAGLALSIV